MILTCPSCTTRYFVKDGAVPSAGRVVRCASCATEWRATPQSEPLALGAFPPASPAAEGAPGGSPRAYRARVEAQKQTRQAVAAGVAWAAVSAVFVLVAFAAVVFRVQVVHAFPRANAAYAAVKMPVNPVGLSLEGVTGGPDLEGGRQILVVTGSLRNVEAGSRAPAPLAVSVFDKAGHRQASQRVVPAAGEIAPGEARAFRAVFYDPPLNAAEFGVDFAWDAPAVARRAPAHTAPPAHDPAAGPGAEIVPARGPVADAAPLPTDSPYALPARATPTAH